MRFLRRDSLAYRQLGDYSSRGNDAKTQQQLMAIDGE
jgi:hypothetical protein